MKNPTFTDDDLLAALARTDDPKTLDLALFLGWKLIDTQLLNAPQIASEKFSVEDLARHSEVMKEVAKGSVVVHKVGAANEFLELVDLAVIGNGFESKVNFVRHQHTYYKNPFYKPLLIEAGGAESRKLWEIAEVWNQIYFMLKCVQSSMVLSARSAGFDFDPDQSSEHFDLRYCDPGELLLQDIDMMYQGVEMSEM